jgi:hypothetical protein
MAAAAWRRADRLAVACESTVRSRALTASREGIRSLHRLQLSYVVVWLPERVVVRPELALEGGTPATEVHRVSKRAHTETDYCCGSFLETGV